MPCKEDRLHKRCDLTFGFSPNALLGTFVLGD